MAKKQKSKLIFYILILLILVALGLFLKKQSSRDNVPANIENWMEEQANKEITISITSKEIKEENFSGKVSTVSGNNALAITTQAYIDKTINEFKKQADIDVPDIRKEFGEDTQSAKYSIDINAKEIQSDKNHSIVLSEYYYTGGAHGNSVYTAFNASKEAGEIITLASIIKPTEQKNFTDFLKNELKNWIPEDVSGPVVWEDEVDNITFDSLHDWSIDKENLTLYFDHYEIGPGVLGAVDFPIPLNKIQSFLEENSG